MPIERPYIKINAETLKIIEEGVDKIYTPDEVARKRIKAKKFKKLTEFEEFIQELGSFSFLFYNYLKKSNIPPEVKTRFIFLTTYIQFSNNGLLVDNDDDKRIQSPMTRDILKDKLKLKEDAFINTIKYLKDDGLIVEEDGNYYISENIAIKGKLSKSQMNRPYTRLFSDFIKKLYNQSKIRQHRQLYYFFAILPLVNFKYNYVCYNREETDLSKIEPMDIRDICEYVGYKTKDWKKFWNNLRYFKIDNQNLISTKIIDYFTYIAINPNLYYAGNNNCLNEVQILLYEFTNENIQNNITTRTNK